MFSDIFPAAAAFLYNNAPLIAVVLIVLVLLNKLRLRARHLRSVAQQARQQRIVKTTQSNWDKYGNTL